MIPKQGDAQRSQPHRRIEKLLDEMGIAYFSEFHFPPYIVDIYLVEWHIAMEIDGPYHSKGKDYTRDRYITEFYGVPIMRLNARIWRGANKLKTLILEFIEENCGQVDERKELWASHASR